MMQSHDPDSHLSRPPRNAVSNMTFEEAMYSWSTPLRCVALDFGGVLDMHEDSETDTGTGDLRRIDGSLPVTPAVVEAIWGLHRLRLKLLVASNTYPGQSREAQLAAAGVRELLLAVLHSDQLGAAKPDPAFFAAIVEVSGCEPNEICYVGNRFQTDIRPALAAGLRAVLVAPPGPLPERYGPDAVPYEVPILAHLRTLPDLIAGTTGKRAW